MALESLICCAILGVVLELQHRPLAGQIFSDQSEWTGCPCHSYDSSYQEQMATLLGGLLHRGYDAVSAQNLSLVKMYATVREQAGLLAYTQTYFILSLAFLGVIPLLFLLKRPGEVTIAGH